LVVKTKGILEQPFSTSLLQLQTYMFIRVTVEKLWRLLTHFVAPLRACSQQMFLAITNSGCWPKGILTPISERLWRF